MTSDMIRTRVLEQQELVKRELTFDEVHAFFEGEMTSEELHEALTRMSADGYLFFDGDVVMVFH